MKTLVWIVTVGLIGLWSLLCWAAYGLLGVGGQLVASNADIVPQMDPLLVEWASWLATVGTGVGEWLIILLWAFITAVLAALGFVAVKLMPRLKSGFQSN